MRGLLVATCVVLACAHQPRPPQLSGWRELRSMHFRLRTNLPEGSARTTLAHLEELRAWLQAAWSTGGDSPGSSNAIVLDDAAELRTFTPMPGIATTTRQGPILVTAGTDAMFGDRSPSLQVLAHEVAHELIRRRMPGAPRWFHEGLAGYLQTVDRVGERRVRFGPVQLNVPGQWMPFDSGLLVREQRLLSLDELGTRHWETATEEEADRLYRSARVWIALLRVEEPGRIRALETALAAGIPWRAAWAALRDGLDLDRLNEKLWRLLQAGGWPTELRAVEPLPPAAREPASERPLAAWEVHLCLAELWAMAGRARGGEGLAPRLRAELEAAVAAAPDEPLPKVRLADLETDPDLRRERAEALVRRYPRNPEARVLLSRVLRDDGGSSEGRRAAAADAVAFAPDDVDALSADAIESVRAGDVDGAFRSLLHAEELEPWNPTVFIARAVVLGAIGRCEDAVDAVQRALDVLPDDPPPADVRALVQERERIRAACRPTHSR